MGIRTRRLFAIKKTIKKIKKSKKYFKKGVDRIPKQLYNKDIEGKQNEKEMMKMKRKELEQLKAIKEKMQFVMESMFYECNNTMGLEKDIEILEKIIKQNEKK